MALKSWHIDEFDGTLPETKVLVDSDDNIVILLTLLIANNSDTDNAEVTIEHLDSDDVVLFHWTLVIPQGNSPFALDSKIVLSGGQKLAVTSDIEDVAVHASGDES